MCAIRAALLAGLSVLAALLAPPAAAQQEPSGTSYITPFPEGDTYKLQAYGDPFADGLLAGLVESFAGDPRVQVARRHRTVNGIARSDPEEELKSDEATRETFHIGVVMLGYYDRIHMRAGPRDRLLLGSEEWREEYGRRVDRFIKALKRRGLALYWVGLPIMRRYEVNDPAQTINDIVRQKTYLNGVKFIDIQSQFADEAGNYAPYGPDIAGKQRLLREVDGILFTAAGNRKLAHFVEQEIKRDIANARSERAIPLAGSEAEQKRVAALRPRTPGTPPADSAWKSTTTPSPKDARRPADTTLEQKADNSRITLKSIGANGREESVTIDIPRPAIPAAVIALVTRNQSGDRPSQTGDVLPEDVGGGLVVLNSVTPGTIGPSGAPRRDAPTQTPFYHVIIKGERLQPKPGRADDFSWPRVEPEIAADPVPASRRLPRPNSRTSPRS